MAKSGGYQPDTIWHRRINWQTLKGFGHSGAATLTMATPFVGYLILYHDAIRPYLGGLGGLLEAGPDRPRCAPWISFQTRLNLLYFGLLALGIGTIIYRSFADNVIKTHSGISDYVERNAPFVTVRNLRSMMVTIRARRSGMSRDLSNRGLWLDRATVKPLPKAIELATADSGSEELKIDVMRSFFNVLDRYSARPWVWAATLLYAIGFLLLAIPGVLFTFRVICTILG